MWSRTGRLARLARGRRLDRNPLRRGSDRAQTIVSGELVVPPGVGANSTVPVWVDQAGQLADPPLSRVQLAARAQLARELAAGALGIALAAASWLTRWLLDRRRMAAWDADWLATGPRWSRQR